MNLGLCYVDAGEHDKANRGVQDRVQAGPRRPRRPSGARCVLIDVGEYAAAIRHLKEVTKVDAENIDAAIDLGIAYCQQGFYAEAERAFKQAQAIDPEEVLASYHLAALYAAWDRPEDALEPLSRALTLDAARVTAWPKATRCFDCSARTAASRRSCKVGSPAQVDRGRAIAGLGASVSVSQPHLQCLTTFGDKRRPIPVSIETTDGRPGRTSLG